ncbi:MAG: hypothetical protein IBJ10_08035 [Phycisphaerales bacterium]|nr:hypothetical protein [Phycisphaerales bacterium]
MDRLGRLFARIRSSLSSLTVTQKLLIGSLVVVMGMTLFLVTLWTAKPAMVELLPMDSPEAQAQAAAFLKERGIQHRMGPGGKVLVPVGMQSVLFAQLGQEGRLPDDTSLLFSNLAAKTSWTWSAADKKQFELIALQNELSKVIGQFRGIRKASVIIDVPAPSGLGMAARKPTASATVFTASGGPISQDTVDAVANLIASARAGLEIDSVRVIDGSNNQQRRARNEELSGASTYLEHAAKVEDRTRDRLLSLLGYIPGVVIAVNAQVDVRRTVSETQRVLEAGKGTVTAPKRETTEERTESAPIAGAEPGVRSNIGLDINRLGVTQQTFSEKRADAEMETQFGRSTERVVDPRGMPLKINATINIPRSYFAALWRAENAGATAEPADADLQPLAQREMDRIRADVQPQVDSSAGAPEGAGAAGEVVVSMIPDLQRLIGGGLEGAAQAGSLGGVATLAAPITGAVKTVALGALAVVALAMMLLMVRKASRSEPLPTPEELVGVPPTLQRGSDVVGEADEADSALAGIELSDDHIKSRKLLEQVEDLVKANPDDTAVLLNRWIQSDD